MTALIIIVACLAAFAAVGYLVMNLYPSFGGRPSRSGSAGERPSANFSNGKFTNAIPTSMSMGFGTTLKVTAEMIKGSPDRRPAEAMPTDPFDPSLLPDGPHAQAVWFGHSALLLRIDGLTLLVDPMFGSAPSPFPIVGGKRYSGKPPLDIDRLPPIDAVLLSHDHYDHLDYGSILRLKAKTKRFFAPLGVGAHLIRWGVPRDKVTEADWWDELTCGGLKLVCAPARHFSGRRGNDRFSTLWCSWVIRGSRDNLFFSGDSGYGPHFREIGEKYGPFNLTFMECGQYDERWSAIHMLPEETVQAHLDVNGRLMIPIHWGAFTLALHSWTDPVERVLRAAREHGAAVATPRIGQPVAIGSGSYPAAPWWR